MDNTTFNQALMFGMQDHHNNRGILFKVRQNNNISHHLYLSAKWQSWIRTNLNPKSKLGIEN